MRSLGADIAQSAEKAEEPILQSQTEVLRIGIAHAEIDGLDLSEVLEAAEAPDLRIGSLNDRSGSVHERREVIRAGNLRTHQAETVV